MNLLMTLLLNLLFNLKALPWIAVILLTLFSCSSLHGLGDGSTHEDPIEKAALIEKNQPISTLFLLRQEEKIQRAIASNSITLGMNMIEVESILGEPQEIQIAGIPQQKNQKWIYLSHIPSGMGSDDSRAVYFEEGLVAGWENTNGI